MHGLSTKELNKQLNLKTLPLNNKFQLRWEIKQVLNLQLAMDILELEYARLKINEALIIKLWYFWIINKKCANKIIAQ